MDDLELPFEIDARPVAPAPNALRTVLLLLLLAGGVGASVAWQLGMAFANELGERSGELALGISSLVGAACVLAGWLTWRAGTAMGALRDLPATMWDNGSDGASHWESRKIADDIIADTTQGHTAVALELANLLVLFGMFGTAFWLARQSNVFSLTTEALSTGGAAQMPQLVGELLELAPRAFVTTTFAVGGAIALSVLGFAQAGLIQSAAPDPRQCKAAWSQGRERFDAKRAESRRQTLTEVIAVANSRQETMALLGQVTSAVTEMSAAAATSRAETYALMHQVSGAVSSISEAITRVEATFSHIRSMSDDLNNASKTVTDVAKTLEATRSVVETFIAGVSAIEQTTSEVVSRTAARVGDVMQNRVDGSMREITERCIQVVQQRDDQLRGGIAAAARDGVAQALAIPSGELDLVRQNAEAGVRNIQSLIAQMDQLQRLWAANGPGMAQGLSKVSEAMTTIAGRGGAAAELTERTGAALDRTTRSMEEAVKRLSGMFAQLRYDAERIGQIKEAAIQGVSRGRS